MHKRKILILSYSNLSSDPRISKQIAALKDSFQIETCAYNACGIETLKFYPIYKEPEVSFRRKFKRLFQLLSKQFDNFYWDDGRQKLREQLCRENYDLIIANDIQTLPLALDISMNKGKVYFDAHEYHPREFEDLLKWKLLYQQYISFLCKKYIPKASAFSTVTDTIANAYKEFTGANAIVINNMSYYHDLVPSELNAEKIKMVHHGAAMRSRKLERMIKMMDFTDERFSLDLILTGNDPSYVIQLKKFAKKNSRIRFIDPVDANNVCKYTNLYDLGIFLLPPTNYNYLNALPNKIFDFIQARLGSIISPNPEMKALVETHHLGIISPDYTPESMALEINKLTPQKIIQFKKNAALAAKKLTAEENINKIRKIVSELLQLPT